MCVYLCVSGELRYYAADTCKPSSLKGVVKLADCTMKITNAKTSQFAVQLSDGSELALQVSG